MLTWRLTPSGISASMFSLTTRASVGGSSVTGPNHLAQFSGLPLNSLQSIGVASPGTDCGSPPTSPAVYCERVQCGQAPFGHEGVPAVYCASQRECGANLAS